MSFLIALNDSFAQVRGQLLLMDPLPAINKVFSLISQEEHQRKVGVSPIRSNSINNMAFALKSNTAQRANNPSQTSRGQNFMDNNGRGQRKERPFCTHCNYLGHTIDKSLWEELSIYRRACTCGRCTCGGVKALSDHYQMEYIMSFLIALNDSFAQVRGQLLLMDPLPAINKVFSLISQEEHQRKVGVSPIRSNSINNMAFALKSNTAQRANNPSQTSRGQNFMDNNGRGQRKERPFCTHCNYLGHTIDKCYKLHGYPPSFRQKPRNF